MNVGDLDTVWFWVADMDRAVAFYRDVLGLPLVYRGGDDWAEFRAGSINLALHGAGADPPHAHGGTVVFRVGDLDVAKAALESDGVRLDQEGEVPGSSRFVQFTDPDGNSLGIIEYREGGNR